MNFGKHPSAILQKIFMEKPYQLQEPEKANIIFLGRDANFAIDIEKDKLFNEFLDYLNDGIKYWKTHNYHTPMLSPDYEGDGQRYHKQFRKIGFSSKDAENICFLELVKYPTFGQSSKYESQYMDMVLATENRDHLNRIKKLQKNNDIVIFIPNGLKKVIEKINLFDIASSNLAFHTHFSNAISDYEIGEIGQRARSVLWQ